MYIILGAMFDSKLYFHWYGGVFTPCKNCNIESRSHDYATVDEVVFSPCEAEQSRAEPWWVAHRVGSSRLVCCQATAINTWMTQEWGSRDRVSSNVKCFNNDATIEVFSRMSYQGFIGETEASSGRVIGEFSVDLKCDVRTLCVL
jgi:hypothetical protein